MLHVQLQQITQDAIIYYILDTAAVVILTQPFADNLQKMYLILLNLESVHNLNLSVLSRHKRKKQSSF